MKTWEKKKLNIWRISCTLHNGNLKNINEFINFINLRLRRMSLKKEVYSHTYDFHYIIIFFIANGINTVKSWFGVTMIYFIYTRKN